MIVWTLLWSNKGIAHSLNQTGSGHCKTKYHRPASSQDIQRKTFQEFCNFVERQDFWSEVLKTVWRQEGLGKLTAGANGMTFLRRNGLEVWCNHATLWPVDSSLCCRRWKPFSTNQCDRRCTLPTVTQIRDRAGLACSEVSATETCGQNRLKTSRLHRASIIFNTLISNWRTQR